MRPWTWYIKRLCGLRGNQLDYALQSKKRQLVNAFWTDLQISAMNNMMVDEGLAFLVSDVKSRLKILRISSRSEWKKSVRRLPCPSSADAAYFISSLFFTDLWATHCRTALSVNTWQLRWCTCPCKKLDFWDSVSKFEVIKLWTVQIYTCQVHKTFFALGKDLGTLYPCHSNMLAFIVCLPFCTELIKMWHLNSKLVGYNCFNLWICHFHLVRATKSAQIEFVWFL